MIRRIGPLILFFTFVLVACEEDELPLAAGEQKLDYYLESYDIDGLGFDPQLKVAYEYNNNGRVSKYTLSSYNPDTGSLEDLRYFVFLYQNGQVDKISGYLPKKSIPYVVYTYAYLPDGNVSNIIEKNSDTGINSEAIFSYNQPGNSLKVAYTFSNGGSFEYEYFKDGGNINIDKTTKGSQLCSDGEYTYDQKVNPFNKLGYVDYLLTNVSANNKLTEKVNYVACAFPSLVPESYVYEYDANGYPTVVTTLYKSGSITPKSRKELFYKGGVK
jgi:hypothetical protein